MNRSEAKKQMRIEMENDIPKEELDTPMEVLGGLSPNQAMSEVDEGTDAGESFLTDYITHNAAGGPLDEETRNHIASMMRTDLKSQDEGFGDRLWIRDPNNGTEYTPNQIIEEVRQGSEVGNLYADQWMATYGRYINTDALAAKKNSN